MAARYRIREKRSGWLIERRGRIFWKKVSSASCYWSAVRLLDAIVREEKEEEK